MTQAPSAKPDHQRPELPDFWDKRFAAGTTPWDHGSAPAELEALLPPPASATPPRILVPGCGHAREAAWLDQRGWAVTALDFAPAAIAAAREVLGEWGGELRCADFFRFPRGSALRRGVRTGLPLRPAAQAVARLWSPGGRTGAPRRLSGRLLLFQRRAQGPPLRHRRGGAGGTAVPLVRAHGRRACPGAHPGLRRRRALAGVAPPLAFAATLCRRVAGAAF